MDNFISCLLECILANAQIMIFLLSYKCSQAQFE